MSKKIIKPQEVPANPFSGNLGKIVSAYVFLMLIVFPLFFTDFYFNILKSKYLFFCVAVIACAVIMLGYSLSRGILVFPVKTDIKAIWKGFSLPDKMLIFFWISLFISTIFSDFKSQAFWGNEGRLTGLFYYTLVVTAYFIITRRYHFSEKLLNGSLAVAVAACLFGITDYFKMDLLHFKVNMSERQKPIYVSTFGNINTYTVFVGIVLALAVVLFAAEKCWKKAAFYYICSVVFMFAIIMGESDNAYLSLAAIFGLTPLYLLKDHRGTRRYGIIVATFFTVVYCIKRINEIFGDRVYGIKSVFNLIANLEFLPHLVIGLWILAIILAVLCRKDKEMDKLWRRAWLALIGIALLTLVYALYDVNCAGGAEKYGSLRKYLEFKDSWGTNRGFVWRISMEMFGEFTLFQKLFGYGPETFGILTNMYYYNDMVRLYRQIYDSAHNEYIQFLVTIGIAGLTAYLGFMFSSVQLMVKRGWKKPHVMAVVFAIAAYMTQAIVNINVPVVAPYLLTLLMIALSECRREKE